MIKFFMSTVQVKEKKSCHKQNSCLMFKTATYVNHKNYNFLDCDWFKKLLFSTCSLAKLLSDSLLLHSSISQ